MLPEKLRNWVMFLWRSNSEAFIPQQAALTLEVVLDTMDPFAQVTHKPIKNMPLVVADYTLHKNLGMGAFGKVKMATHKHTKCRVAVKVMNHVRIESQKMSEKVKREISILEKCSKQAIFVKLAL